ncbi:hypothetical protein DH2020_010577 [Rehmannia glutinosa]|uniref:Shugoshin C-terminal domain-containing protein n=1 Tax=Rehmannia glutinosa TaxID=99300 RepID=A0ABR0XB21_REHGL
MSRTEGFLILDQQNAATTITGDIAKKAARPRPRSVVRRKLADISNLPQNERLLIQEEKSHPVETTTKGYIHQLQKVMLSVGLSCSSTLFCYSIIIEQSGTELDRLRELNSGKDRLKVLQHELGCKSALLNARKLQRDEKARTSPCKIADAELIKSLEGGESSKEDKVDEKIQVTKRGSQSNTLDSSEQVQSKEKTENKRTFVRRQSARFKAVELNPAEDLFETGDAKVPARLLPDDPVPEQGSTYESAHVENEVNTGSSGLRYESQEFGRSSLCRPSRLAAKKVKSYREIPINVKMRRPV